MRLSVLVRSCCDRFLLGSQLIDDLAAEEPVIGATARISALTAVTGVGFQRRKSVSSHSGATGAAQPIQMMSKIRINWAASST